LALARFRLIPFRSPLLRESLLLSSPRGTEMFQFPRFPLPALCVQAGVTPHYECRVSPFGHPRIDAWSTAPRGFSQPPTSFFGFRRQGIHRWLFVAWRIRCSCSLWSSQGTARARRRRSLKTEQERPPHHRCAIGWDVRDLGSRHTTTAAPGGAPISQCSTRDFSTVRSESSLERR
jgi:hypothetical protein